MSEKNSDLYHELTVLFMKNSVKLSDYTAPEDYARIYLENYYRIKKAFAETKGAVMADTLRKSNVGWLE